MVAGHTIVELLVALAITVLVFAAVLAVVVPASEGFTTLPEHTDVQQRLRSAVDAMRSDLLASRGGPAGGNGGHTGQAWPSVLPCGWGDDPVSGARGPCARGDVFSVIRVLRPLEVMVAGPLGNPRAAVPVSRPPGCPVGDTGCEFVEDDPVILADGFGRADVFVVEDAAPGGSPLGHATALSGAYPEGSTLSSASVRTYYVTEDARSQSLQLRRRDSDSQQPVLDHLAGLSIEYFGIADAPSLQPDERGELRASFGLPPLRVAGEPSYQPTCAFTNAGTLPVTRMQALPATADGLAALPLAVLRDGPWCPDDASPWRFDLDLVRVRRVRITVRAQAAAPWFRGTHPAWFARPGLARAAGRMVPDVEAVFDLAIRGAGR